MEAESPEGTTQRSPPRKRWEARSMQKSDNPDRGDTLDCAAVPIFIASFTDMSRPWQLEMALSG